MGLTQVDDRGLKTPIDLLDNEKIRLGTGNDLEIYFNGTNSVISHVPNSGDLILQAPTGETSIRCNASSAVELYHDNVKRFETDSNGVRVVAPEGEQAILRLLGDEADDANDSFRLNAGGGTLKIQDASNQSSWEDNIVINAAGSVELYYDNSKKLDTTSAGIEVTGRIALMDASDSSGSGNALWLGAGNDLKIFHDGTDSKIQNTTDSDLKIINGGNAGMLIQNQNSYNIEIKTNAEDAIKCVANGAVELYYDNSKKIETTSEGISVTGAVYSSTGVVGEDASNHFDFVTDNRIAVSINGSEEFRFESDGDFHADGDVIAYSTTISSDEKLKENIKIVPDSLDKIEALRGVTFDWKRDGKSSAGVIAQDVMGVLPEAVKEVQGLNDKESYLSVNYHALTSILIEAIKDLSAKIKVLEAK